MKGIILSEPMVDSTRNTFYPNSYFENVTEKYSISKEYLVDQYFTQNKSQDEISKELGVSQWVISRRMMEFNLEVKDPARNLSRRKYSVNENFFDDLNKTSAWVLGWIVSDGYVVLQNEHGVFGLKVALTDEDIVHKIKNLVNYTGPTYQVKAYLEKTGKQYDQIHLKISSRKIVDKLSEYGIIQNKSLIIKYPCIIRQLRDEEISRSFIQGIFEGDGSILFDKKFRSPCFQIVGTKELLEGIQDELVYYVGILPTKLTKNTRLSNHYALRYRGKFKAMKIFDWIYKNCEYFLDRKHKLYLEIKKEMGA